MQQIHVTEERLVEQSRERPTRGLVGRERAARWVGALTFLAAAVPLALLGHSHRPLSWSALLVVVVLFGLATRMESEIGAGAAVPPELVVVTAPFVLPVTIVPLAVAAG